MQQSRKRTHAAWPLAMPENMNQRERAPAAAALQLQSRRVSGTAMHSKLLARPCPGLTAYSVTAPELATAASAELALARLAGAAAPLPAAGFAAGASPSAAGAAAPCAPHTCARGPRRLGAGSLGSRGRGRRHAPLVSQNCCASQVVRVTHRGRAASVQAAVRRADCTVARAGRSARVPRTRQPEPPGCLAAAGDARPLARLLASASCINAPTFSCVACVRACRIGLEKKSIPTAYARPPVRRPETRLPKCQVPEHGQGPLRIRSACCREHIVAPPARPPTPAGVARGRAGPGTCARRSRRSASSSRISPTSSNACVAVASAAVSRRTADARSVVTWARGAR